MRHPFSALPIVALPIVAIALASACAASAPTDPLRSNPRAVVNATVRFQSIEGGCWTLHLSQNVSYLPLNLPEQFRQDGLQVQVDLLRRDDHGSVCMIGPVVEILSIRSR